MSDSELLPHRATFRCVRLAGLRASHPLVSPCRLVDHGNESDVRSCTHNRIMTQSPPNSGTLRIGLPTRQSMQGSLSGPGARQWHRRQRHLQVCLRNCTCPHALEGHLPSTAPCLDHVIGPRLGSHPMQIGWRRLFLTALNRGFNQKIFILPKRATRSGGAIVPSPRRNVGAHLVSRLNHRGLPRFKLDLGIDSGFHIQQVTALLNTTGIGSIGRAIVMIRGEISSTGDSASAVSDLAVSLSYTEADPCGVARIASQKMQPFTSKLMATEGHIRKAKATHDMSDTGIAQDQRGFIGNPTVIFFKRSRDKLHPDKLRALICVRRDCATYSLHRTGTVDIPETIEEMVAALKDALARDTDILPSRPRVQPYLEERELPVLIVAQDIGHPDHADFTSIASSSNARHHGLPWGSRDATTSGKRMTMRPNSESLVGVAKHTHHLVKSKCRVRQIQVLLSWQQVVATGSQLLDICARWLASARSHTCRKCASWPLGDRSKPALGSPFQGQKYARTKTESRCCQVVCPEECRHDYFCPHQGTDQYRARKASPTT